MSFDPLFCDLDPVFADCCAAESGRFLMDRPFFFRGMICATDGAMCVRMPCPSEELAEKYALGPDERGPNFDNLAWPEPRPERLKPIPRIPRSEVLVVDNRGEPPHEKRVRHELVRFECGAVFASDRVGLFASHGFLYDFGPWSTSPPSAFDEHVRRWRAMYVRRGEIEGLLLPMNTQTCGEVRYEVRTGALRLAEPGRGSEPGKRRTVEMLPAGAWVCDACGRDNYCRLTAPPVSDLAAHGRAMIHEPNPSEHDAEWFSAPGSVVCRFCGVRFDVEDQKYGAEGGGADE